MHQATGPKGALDILLCGTSAQGQSLLHALEDLGHHVTEVAGQSARVLPKPPPCGQRFDLIIDAAHPFDVVTQGQAAQIAQTQHSPLWQIDRPKWDVAQYNAAQSPDIHTALRHIGPNSIVFVATGYEDVEPCRARADVQFYIRQIRKDRDEQYDNIEFLASDPPFETSAEIALLGRLNATDLIIRNAGGSGARPKLDAAHALGLRIHFIAPPPRLQATGNTRVFTYVTELLEALNG